VEKYFGVAKRRMKNRVESNFLVLIMKNKVYILFLASVILLASVLYSVCFAEGTSEESELVAFIPDEEPICPLFSDAAHFDPPSSPVTESDYAELTFSFAGDCTLGFDKDFDPRYRFDTMVEKKNRDFSYFLGGVKHVFNNDDMTLVNLEGVFTDRTEEVKKAYNFKGSLDYVKILTSSSVEAVSLGNNHSRDFGEEGLDDTKKVLAENDIAYSVDSLAGIYEVRGFKIGFISVNIHYDGTKVEGFIIKAMKSLESENVDVLIVSCHWGVEKSSRLNDYQKYLGHKIIDWGADIVVGTHPHVLQGIEMYKGKYIYYSLANFCFGGNMNPSDKDTMIVSQSVRLEKGKYKDSKVQIIPCSVSSKSYINDYRPTEAKGNEKSRIIGRMNALCDEFSLCIDDNGFMNIDL